MHSSTSRNALVDNRVQQTIAVQSIKHLPRIFINVSADWSAKLKANVNVGRMPICLAIEENRIYWYIGVVCKTLDGWEQSELFNSFLFLNRLNVSNLVKKCIRICIESEFVTSELGLTRFIISVLLFMWAISYFTI